MFPTFRALVQPCLPFRSPTPDEFRSHRTPTSATQRTLPRGSDRSDGRRPASRQRPAPLPRSPNTQEAPGQKWLDVHTCFRQQLAPDCWRRTPQAKPAAHRSVSNCPPSLAPSAVIDPSNPGWHRPTDVSQEPKLFPELSKSAPDGDTKRPAPGRVQASTRPAAVPHVTRRRRRCSRNEVTLPHGPSVTVDCEFSSSRRLCASSRSTCVIGISPVYRMVPFSEPVQVAEIEYRPGPANASFGTSYHQ